MRPVIGITAEINDDGILSLKHPYTHAIEEAGATPIVLPYICDGEALRHFVSLCDGFLFTGGVDVHPRHFGEELSPRCGEIQEKRDEYELALIPHVIKSGKPVLAICRGMQIINVALGGTLHQDISLFPSDISHRQREGLFDPSHSVNISDDSPLLSLVRKKRICANSFHHQAVKDLAEGLVPMAYADDGIIEAYYLRGDQYIRGYQWHPERLFESDADNRRIFEDFIKECR